MPHLEGTHVIHIAKVIYFAATKLIHRCFTLQLHTFYTVYAAYQAVHKCNYTPFGRLLCHTLFFLQKSKTNHVISVSSNSSKAQSAYMAGQLHSCSAFLVEVERRVILELLSSPSPSLSLSAHGESNYDCSLSFSLSALGTLWLLSLSLTLGTTGLSTLGTGRE